MTITRRTTLAGIGAGTGVMLAGCTDNLFMQANAQTSGPVIDVSAAPGAISGTLRFGALEFPCMVGRTGIRHPKYEGDGGTPAGLFALREVRFRPDKVAAPPTTALPKYPTLKNDGWCDDPEDPNYNRLVGLPYQADCETMWRPDYLYDVLAVIGYNDSPPVPGAGSAIFLHVMRTDAAGAPGATTGCVSLKIENLLAVLAQCVPGQMIRIRTA